MLLRLEKFLVLALAVFLPSQLGFHWWPAWGLVFGVRSDYLSPVLYFTDIIIFLLLIVSFWKIKLTPSFWWLILLLIAVVNIYFASSPQVAFYHWIRLLEAFGLGAYFFFRLVSVKKVLTAGLMIALVWTSMLSVWQFVRQESINGPWYYLGERSFSLSTPGIAKTSFGNWGLVLRSYATLPHPNAMAGFLVLASALVWYLLSTHEKKYCLPIILLVAVAILFSGSRSGIFFGLLIVVANNKYMLWLSPLVLVSLFLPGNPQSLQERFFLNKEAFKIIMSHPLWGIGLGNFVLGLKTIFQPVHNIYLLVLSEMGIVAGLGVTSLLGKIIKKLIKNKDWYLLTILIGVGMVGLVDHYWLTIHQTSILLTILFSMITLKSFAHE